MKMFSGFPNETMAEAFVAMVSRGLFPVKAVRVNTEREARLVFAWTCAKSFPAVIVTDSEIILPSEEKMIEKMVKECGSVDWERSRITDLENFRNNT